LNQYREQQFSIWPKTGQELAEKWGQKKACPCFCPHFSASSLISLFILRVAVPLAAPIPLT
jgi:hypothetical protein